MLPKKFDPKSEFKGGWIGVDFDACLASYTGWKGAGFLGEPLMPRVNRAKGWLAQGRNVRIMTARVCSRKPKGYENDVEVASKSIQAWCVEHLGQSLEVTHEKDYNMIELWDDRAVQVEANTGIRLSIKSRIEKDPIGSLTLREINYLKEKTKGLETINEWKAALREFADAHGIEYKSMNGIWGLEFGNVHL